MYKDFIKACRLHWRSRVMLLLIAAYCLFELLNLQNLEKKLQSDLKDGKKWVMWNCCYLGGWYIWECFIVIRQYFKFCHAYYISLYVFVIFMFCLLRSLTYTGSGETCNLTVLVSFSILDLVTIGNFSKEKSCSFNQSLVF